MYYRKMYLIFSYITLIVISVNALDIAGINLPEKLETESDTLILNGGGVRTKWGLKIYVGGLYLLKESHNAKEIIALDKPMAIKMHMISGLVTSERMSSSTREGFKKSAKNITDSLQQTIDKFITVFSDKINKGDVFDLIYIPNEGTKVYKNGKYLSTTLGLKFKQALFGIWFCNEPAHKKLKERMLGI